ncbi:MAG: SUMF1/EgtB/PvdO family nonheme iron enzyme [Nitrospirota bacterium]
MQTRFLTLVTVGVVSCVLCSSALAETRGVKIDGKAAADYVAGQTGKSWAVVIGIDQYEKVRRLKYAVADARAVADELGRRGYQVAALYDQQATRRNILKELGDKLVDRVGEPDRVVIYYAGHGETKKSKGGKEMGYLLPVNGEQDALAETAISMGLIKELADALPSKHVLFLVDVCYGGIAGQQFRSTLPPMTEAYLKTITREKGRQLITAGGPDQQAMEAPEWGHSVFTYYLLEGLRKGLADLNDDGIVPASELYSYLESRVFSAAQSKGHRQRPELWKLANEPGEFVFFAAARPAAVRAEPRRRPAPGPVPGPSAALTQAEQELQALQEQERALEEQEKQAALQRQIEEKMRQLEERKKKIELAKAYDLPKQTGRELTGRDGAPMLLVPDGEFLYGDSNQRLSLPAFYMDKYEVSTAQYAKFMAESGRAAPVYWETSVPVSYGQKPVVGVTWYDADAYCRHYGKRLPTEQEWEKAARGTDGREYPWGDEAPTSRHANYGKSCGGFFSCEPYRKVLQSVGNYEAGKSPYGIYDLAGNVWEWTSSDDNSRAKVLRGGSWDDDAFDIRSAIRRGVVLMPGSVGFRCAKTP